MTAYVARRVVALVPLWLGISLFAFWLASLAPGDPAELILQESEGEAPTVEEIQALRDELGLNDPFFVQYGRWVGDALTGDLGTSFRSGEEILPALVRRFQVTLVVALPALAVALLVALPTGLIAAVRRNTVVDHTSRLAALLLASVPSFWLAYLLIIVFSVNLRLLPVAGRGTLLHLVLPAATLGVATTASLMRLTRSSLLDVLGEDYITAARAMGIRERTVIGRYAVKNAMIPVVTLAGLIFGFFVTGTVIIETVFAWPGLGKFVVDSIFDRDYPVIQGFVVFTGTMFVVINLVIDLLYAWLDPRVRLAESTGGSDGG